MARALSEEQNAYARDVIRELWRRFGPHGSKRFKTQGELGKKIGLDQTRVSALLAHNSQEGTSVAVIVAAAKLAGRTDAEVANILGLRRSGIPVKDVIPERARAIEAARLLQLDERAIDYAMSLPVPTNARETTELLWFDVIRRKHEELHDPMLSRIPGR